MITDTRVTPAFLRFGCGPLLGFEQQQRPDVDQCFT